VVRRFLTDCFYDVSYDRTYFDPSNTTCSGTPGNNMVFDESIDQFTSDNVSLDVIDPTMLPRRLNEQGNCVPVFPHDAIPELRLKFRNPANDSRTPDIIVQPVYGTIYTGSGSKNAEHGGFSFGDTNVGLIVSNPDLHRHVVKSPVATSQVAPTVLKVLGIDPNQLGAVRKEGTQVLPFLFSDSGEDDR
jgi:arylsulfatase A-like enzyme